MGLRDILEEQRSEHPRSNILASSSHFVAQFSGSRGPTDPSGHVLTMGIPSGDGVGIEFGASEKDGAPDGTADGAEDVVLRDGKKVGKVEGATALPIGDEDGKAVPFSQGKISGKHSEE